MASSIGNIGKVPELRRRILFTLACLAPEDYPVMSAGELPHHFTLSAAELRGLIDRTRFAFT